MSSANSLNRVTMEDSARRSRACLRGVALAVLTAAVGGCTLFERPRADPIPVRIHGDVEAADRVYVLLPGRGDDLDSFEKNGFLDIARRSLGGGARVAFVAVDAHFGYYRSGEIFRRIKDQVVDRYLAGKRVTAVGISMGGLGAVATARRHPGLFERLVLIAPYLGDRGDITRLKRGGTPTASDDREREVNAVWKWLSDGGDGLPIVLLYGRDDAFRPVYEYLAERAPQVTMRHIDGGHKWRTWNILWGEWLARR